MSRHLPAFSGYNAMPMADKSIDVRFPDYFRRLIDFKQMDFESTFDQMIHLLSPDPENAFKNFYYRKQTKNQWARDDPAFVVVEAAFVAVATLAYAVAFMKPSLFGYLWVVLYSVVVDWLLVGIIVSVTCCYIANKYLKQQIIHTVDQDVELLYAFDIHVNAFLCSFSITYVLQFLLLPLVMSKSIISCILSNTLYAAAIIWYAYITHLGYKALPFLGNTQVFLWYCIVAVIVAWIFLMTVMILGLPINCSRVVMNFHYG